MDLPPRRHFPIWQRESTRIEWVVDEEGKNDVPTLTYPFWTEIEMPPSIRTIPQTAVKSQRWQKNSQNSNRWMAVSPGPTPGCYPSRTQGCTPGPALANETTTPLPRSYPPTTPRPRDVDVVSVQAFSRQERVGERKYICVDSSRYAGSPPAGHLESVISSGQLYRQQLLSPILEPTSISPSSSSIILP